jgi:hypothetical protein
MEFQEFAENYCNKRAAQLEIDGLGYDSGEASALKWMKIGCKGGYQWTIDAAIEQLIVIQGHIDTGTMSYNIIRGMKAEMHEFIRFISVAKSFERGAKKKKP